VLILSDLLHFDSFHDQLVKSITSSLKRSPDSRVHIAAGVYTKPDVCDSFLAKSTEAGLQFEEIHTNPAEPWKGTLTVGGLDSDDLATRKAACRYWVGRYARVEPY
jgi:nicotinamide N-methyltransferase